MTVQLNRLLFVYLSALALLLGSVMASMIFTEMRSSELVEDAAKINVSGRQRMLSQRIIYLAQDLSISQGQNSDQTRAELLAAINELQTAVALFDQSHGALTADTELGSSTHDLYFSAEAGRQTLDARIEDYLNYARGILDNPTDAASLAGLLEIERGGLLNDLDAVVTDIERTSVERISTLRALERWSLILALLIVIMEIAFVFLPGHRYIKTTLTTLRETNRDLSKAVETSEALRKEQAEFTYAVSHDLKSPANSIGLILSEVLIEETDRLSPDGKEMITEASAIVDRIGGQVEDILQYAWATAGERDVRRLDLTECAQAVLDNLKQEIQVRQAKIEMQLDAEVFGYERQVQMLLQNLLSNALKFQKPGNVPEITVTARNLPGDAGTEITVEDNGIGIAQEDQGRVFQLFEKLHLRDVYEGTGLGLATCKRIADNHHGHIKITSDIDKGTRFTVLLRNPTHTTSSEPERRAA